MPTPLSQTFINSYSQLNAGQKKAVDAIEGPVMVIAGPGTGKTTILTLRIANILKETDTAPQNILALTFTESGAYAMRRKLFDIIGAAAYKVNIHTFHGFAARVIEQYPDYFSRIIGSRVITEPERIKIIKKAVMSSKIKRLRPYGDQDYYVAPILREIQTLKRENISPKHFEKSVENTFIDPDLSKTEVEKLKKQSDKNLELSFVYAEYEKSLVKEKFYDFEDMLLELIRAMEENDEFKLILQENYQYVLADEHQDANAAQNRILELLSDFHESPNLFIVGDDKQAIYRFQGATLENFLYFKNKYKDAVVIDLEHNYRSHQGILDASHSLIAKNPVIPGHERKRLISLQVGTMPIYVTECENTYEEVEIVSNKIKKIIENGGKEEDIAVLYRDNKHAELISRTLKAKGIKYRVESEQNLLTEPDVVKILYITKIINNPSDNELLGKTLLLREMNCDPMHVTQIFGEARRQEKNLHEYLKNYADTAKAYKRIVAWSEEAQILQCTDFMQKLIEESGILEDIIKDNNSLERLDALQAFYDYVVSLAAAKKTFYLSDFIEFLGIAEDHGISSKKSYSEHVKGVRLMTAHKAKGLEFDEVFIIHGVDGVWGNRSSRNLFSIPIIEHARNVGRIEDERRLFYVALTRARNSVFISYSKRDQEKELLPTQFISEIDSVFLSFEKSEDTSSQDKIPEKAHPINLQKKSESKSNTLLDQEFVKSKFLAQPLSVTHLNNYLECAWKYFFVNLVRIPQAENKHQMYGTAIHSVLRSYFDAYREGKKKSIKEVLALFKHALDKLPLSKHDRNESFEKGRKALEGYFEQYDSLWNRDLLNEYAVKSGYVWDEKGAVLELTGKLDKIEFIDPNNVVVVDYKTGKPKSRNEIEGKTKDADGNYKRQLVFYKLLLSAEDKKKNFQMQYGEIDFVEPNERGVYKKERFEILPQDLIGLRKEISLMAADITSMTFVEKGCGKKDCEYCKLGKLLRATA